MMDVFQLRQGRYLMYLDILGFKELVRTRSPKEVYGIVDHALQQCSYRERMIHDFRTLYFSDTIVFYQKPIGWGSWAFCDVYAIGGMIWSALAAAGIPSRGAIAFGEFTVEADSAGRHEIFFGSALIEAYETENHEDHRDWVGLTLCPSAWQAMDYMEPGTIECFASEGRWRKVEDVLRLNPFMKLGCWHRDYLIGEVTGPLAQWDAPDFPNDVKALGFIAKQARNADLPEPVSRKYRFTLPLLTEMLGEDCVTWAEEILPEVTGGATIEHERNAHG